MRELPCIIHLFPSMVMPFKITVQYHKQDIDIDTGRYRSPFTARNPRVPFCSYDFLPLLLILNPLQPL